MANGVNRVILIGSLGRDPEVRFLQDGSKVVDMSVVTSESWRDKQSGERREKVEWHPVVILDQNLAEVAEKYLKKGSKIFIAGQLQTRKWTDQAGQDRYITEVILARFRSELTILDDRAEGIEAGGEDTAAAA